MEIAFEQMYNVS